MTETANICDPKQTCYVLYTYRHFDEFTAPNFQSNDRRTKIDNQSWTVSKYAEKFNTDKGSTIRIEV